MILCDFNELNAMGFGLIRLEDDMTLSLLGMQGFGLTAINRNMVDVPSINQIDCDFFAILETEVDFKTSPVVGHISISYIVTTMEDDLG